jgi:4-hydroxymandelate oxidase
MDIGPMLAVYSSLDATSAVPGAVPRGSGDRVTAWSLLDPDELEAAARAVLPDGAFQFVAGGADDEHALTGNRAAFDGYALVPRVLTGCRQADLSVAVGGTALAAPVIVSPMGMQRLVHPRGELATAAAAAAAGVGYVASTGASFPLEEVAAVAPQARWFQLYFLRDRAVTEDLLRRAEAAGYKAIVLTVDVPVGGRRPRELRSGFVAPAGVAWVNLDRYSAHGEGTHAGHRALISDDLTWADVSWITARTTLPVLLKGVLSADDASLALEHGAGGIFVSNHGGRQLGRVVAPLHVLPAIADAVAGRVPIILDGGVRRPSDAVVAGALGATAVGLGRPVLWSVALGGEEAAAETLHTFVDGVHRTLVLMGQGSFSALDERSLLRR